MGRGASDSSGVVATPFAVEASYLAVLSGDAARQTISAPTNQRTLVEFSAYGDREALATAMASGKPEELWRLVSSGRYQTVWSAEAA